MDIASVIMFLQLQPWNCQLPCYLPIGWFTAVDLFLNLAELHTQFILEFGNVRKAAIRLTEVLEIWQTIPISRVIEHLTVGICRSESSKNYGESVKTCTAPFLRRFLLFLLLFLPRRLASNRFSHFLNLPTQARSQTSTTPLVENR